MLAWTPDLALDVPAIDAQHQELFRRLNQIQAAVQGRAGSEEVYRTLAFLGEYVVVHTAMEEQLMREVAFPGAADHAAEHARFIATFQRLRSAFARAGVDAGLARQVEEEMCAWLVDHVSGTDRRLAEHLHARGGGAQAGGLRPAAPASSARSASAGSEPRQA